MKILIAIICTFLFVSSFAMSGKAPDQDKAPQKGKPKVSKSVDFSKMSHDQYQTYMKKIADRSCKTKDDCEATCLIGAVNKKWLDEARKDFSDCEDGCSGWGNHAVCQEGVCRTASADGKVDLNSSCNK